MDESKHEQQTLNEARRMYMLWKLRTENRRTCRACKERAQMSALIFDSRAIRDQRGRAKLLSEDRIFVLLR